jgi:hypothetical protein
MVRNLYGDRAKPAAQTEVCLKCHATGGGADADAVGARFWIGDGVGCESCHGAAERWLGEHYRDPYRSLPPDQKVPALEPLGMRNLRNLEARAKLCSQCHVGDKDHDVNHDLIAAGHPRLNFEFSGALAIYPRHWTNRENEAQAWVVGQLVCADAALRLLEARAAKQPWPEFAEYNCYGCHKDLSAKLPVRKDKDHKLGAPTWGTWYLSLSKDLTGADLGPLRRTMETLSPDARKAGEEARVLAGVFEQRLRALAGPVTPDRALELMRGLTTEWAPRTSVDFDEACQLYLALAALNPGKDRPDDPVRAELAKMGRELRASFDPRYTSPKLYDQNARKNVNVHLRAILGDLGGR